MNMNTLLKNADGYALAFRANDITTTAMRNAIAEWFDLYYQQNHNKQEDPCQKIPYTIVQKLTKAIFPEYEATSENQYAESLLDALKRKSQSAMQMALIGGECSLKPVPVADGFRFEIIPRHNMLVFGRDPDGNMTDVGTVEQTAKGNAYYTLLERRTVDTRGYLTIQYRLFRSYNKDSLGQEVPLDKVQQYEELEPEYTFTQPIGSTGLIGLHTPMSNCVDGSADHVSVYAAAVGLIHNINRNEALLSGEFERGQSRVIVSDDMLKPDESGKKRLDDNLFVGLDEDPENTGITIFSPALREASFLARKQEYLRNVENVIGLKRGLLSEVEAAERTATEITSSQGEYALTITALQEMWGKTVRETMRVCSILGKLYKIPGACEIPEDAVVINWGNGILYDEEKKRQELLAQVQAGLLQPERYLGHCYNLPCDTVAQRAKIRRDYMPETKNLIEE